VIILDIVIVRQIVTEIPAVDLFFRHCCSYFVLLLTVANHVSAYDLSHFATQSAMQWFG
jgi:hypothetical protein